MLFAVWFVERFGRTIGVWLSLLFCSGVTMLGSDMARNETQCLGDQQLGAVAAYYFGFLVPISVALFLDALRGETHAG